jgi:hypothetical protein
MKRVVRDIVLFERVELYIKLTYISRGLQQQLMIQPESVSWEIICSYWQNISTFKESDLFCQINFLNEIHGKLQQQPSVREMNLVKEPSLLIMFKQTSRLLFFEKREEKY